MKQNFFWQVMTSSTIRAGGHRNVKLDGRHENSERSYKLLEFRAQHKTREFSSAAQRVRILSAALSH